MKVDWLSAGVGLPAFELLIVGLITGRMPNAVIEPQKEQNSLGYWALGMLYAAIAIGSFYIAIR